MKPLSKPLPGTGRGFEPFSLYNKKDETPLYLIEKNNQHLQFKKGPIFEENLPSAIHKTMYFYTECSSI